MTQELAQALRALLDRDAQTLSDQGVLVRAPDFILTGRHARQSVGKISLDLKPEMIETNRDDQGQLWARIFHPKIPAGMKVVIRPDLVQHLPLYNMSYVALRGQWKTRANGERVLVCDAEITAFHAFARRYDTVERRAAPKSARNAKTIALVAPYLRPDWRAALYQDVDRILADACRWHPL